MGAEDGIESDDHLKESPNGSAPSSTEEGLHSRLKNTDYRRKCLRTFWLGAAFMALGFVLGQRGPAFLDIQIITRTDVELASFFFTGGSVGYLSGSLVAGVIYDKLNKSILLFGCVLGLAVTTAATPFCSIYGLMIAAFFLSSMFGGGLDVVGNAELIRIWGKEGKMAMQFIHFAFAFGAVISPLLTEPFLTPNPEDEEDKQTINSTTPFVTEANTSAGLSNVMESMYNQSNTTGNSTVGLPLTTDVHYAYLICGIIIFLTSIPLIVEWFQEKARKRRQDKKDEKNVKQPLPFTLFLLVQFVLCFFYFVFSSVEDSFAAYLTTFVVKQLHWSKSHGAKVTSLFWASYASGRFLSIFAIKLVSTVKLLTMCLITLIVGMLGFMLASQQGATYGVWVCAALVGATMSAVFPTGFTWMEHDLVRVTGRVVSFILFASSSGTMINPIILGYLMEEVSHMWFPYLLFVEACVSCLVFFFLLSLSRLYLQKHYAVHESAVLPEAVIPTLETKVKAPDVDGHPVGSSVM